MNSSELYTWLIEESLKKKNDVTMQSIEQIINMYEQLSKELTTKAKKAKGGFSKAWLADYSKFLDFKAQQLYSMQYKIVTGAIKEGARISASVNGDFFSYINGKYNLDIPKEYLNYAYSVNDDVLALKIIGGFY